MRKQWFGLALFVCLALMLPLLVLGADLFFLYGRTFHDINSNGKRDSYIEDFDNLFVCIGFPDGTGKCGTTDASEYEWEIEEYGVYRVSVDTRQDLLEGFAITSVTCTANVGSSYPCEIEEWLEEGVFVGYRVYVEYSEGTAVNGASVNFGFELFTPTSPPTPTSEPTQTITPTPTPTIVSMPTLTATPVPSPTAMPSVYTNYLPVLLCMPESCN